ncbi:unnamed protein product [Pieris brassicae]|uniref:Uncharacterized protein n=1 Tax=Pieris brassicae TaxID=7116 RepID=A0A9P0TL48_PIEBR|nr:unnamed protein product [Pieris brassicae]
MNVSEGIGSKLWQLTTHRTITTFINGKPLIVEYNCDPWRKKKGRVPVNIDSLLPVFGGVRLPKTCARSVGTPLVPVILKPYNAGKFAKSSLDTCEFQHFHHYCWQHVSHWLMCFFNSVLMPPEDNRFFDEHTTRGYLNFLNKTIHFRDTNHE